MQTNVKNIESGRPARGGQSILERRYRIISSIIGDKLKDARMLDIGCGNGVQTVYFKDDVKRLVGLDMVPIQQTETPVDGAAFDFIRGGALELPFISDLFDVVTSIEVLEHLLDDGQAVSEVVRVLKPGGVFFLTVPNKWWLFESHGANVPRLNWIPWNRVPFIGWLPRPIHERFARARTYTMKRAVSLVKNRGLESFSSGYISAPLDVLPDSALRRWFRQHVFKDDTAKSPFLAVNLFVAARK